MPTAAASRAAEGRRLRLPGDPMGGDPPICGEAPAGCDARGIGMGTSGCPPGAASEDEAPMLRRGRAEVPAGLGGPSPPPLRVPVPPLWLPLGLELPSTSSQSAASSSRKVATTRSPSAAARRMLRWASGGGNTVLSTRVDWPSPMTTLRPPPPPLASSARGRPGGEASSEAGGGNRGIGRRCSGMRPRCSCLQLTWRARGPARASCPCGPCHAKTSG